MEEEGFGGPCLHSKWVVSGRVAAGMVVPVLGVVVCEPLRTRGLTFTGPFPLFPPQSLSSFSPRVSLQFPFLSFLSPLFFLCRPCSCSLPLVLSSCLALSCRDEAGRRAAQGKSLPALQGMGVLFGSRKRQLFRHEGPKVSWGPMGGGGGSLKVELALSWVPTHPPALFGQWPCLLCSACAQSYVCVPLPPY